MLSVLLALLALILLQSVLSFRARISPKLSFRTHHQSSSSSDELFRCKAHGQSQSQSQSLSLSEEEDIWLRMRRSYPHAARIVEQMKSETKAAVAETQETKRELQEFASEHEHELPWEDMKFAAQESLRKRQLGPLTQRYLLERLFEKVVAACREPQTRHTLASISALPAHLLDALCFDAPSAKTVYQLLCVGAAREVLWERVGLSQTCALPCFAEESLCGGLRTLPRSPADDKAFVSDLAPREKKAFFAEIGRLFAMQVEEYSEIKSIVGAQREIEREIDNITFSL